MFVVFSCLSWSENLRKQAKDTKSDKGMQLANSIASGCKWWLQVLFPECFGEN